MIQTKTIFCEKHGEQERHIIKHRGADGVRNDMDCGCNICWNESEIGLWSCYPFKVNKQYLKKCTDPKFLK